MRVPSLRLAGFAAKGPKRELLSVSNSLPAHGARLVRGPDKGPGGDGGFAGFVGN